MSHCPNCHGKIPFRKFLWLNNFSTIRCVHCGTELVPDRKVLSRIGGIGGLSAALTVWLAAAVYRSIEGLNHTWFIAGTALLVVALYLALVFITRNTVDFKVKPEKAPKQQSQQAS